jgi:hypothetical protein
MTNGNTPPGKIEQLQYGANRFWPLVVCAITEGSPSDPSGRPTPFPSSSPRRSAEARNSRAFGAKLAPGSTIFA